MKETFKESTPLDDFLFLQINNCSGKILDYGCGRGRFIEYCLARGVVIDGADSYGDIYDSWMAENSTVMRIKHGIVPATSNSYEIVLSNQVLEHVPNEAVLEVSRELTRLLTNTGFGFHIFPTKNSN